MPVEQPRLLFDVTGVFLAARIEDCKGLRWWLMRREEKQIARRMYPAILEVEANQRSKARRPCVYRLCVCTARLIGNMIDLRGQAAEWHQCLLGEGELIDAQF